MNTLLIALLSLTLTSATPARAAESMIAAHADWIASDESTDFADESSDDAATVAKEVGTQKGISESGRESIFAILKSYRAYKKAHPGEVKAFKRGYRAVLAELKDAGSALSQNIAIAKEACKTQPAQCRRIMNQLVSARIEAQLRPESTAWLRYFLPSAHASDILVQGCVSSVIPPQESDVDTDLNFHALLFGAQDYDCGDKDVRIKVFGPGVSVELAGFMILACSGNKNGNNVGLIAGGSAVLGAKTGMYLGKTGLCTMIGLTGVGVGAYAGISVMKISD